MLKMRRSDFFDKLLVDTRQAIENEIEKKNLNNKSVQKKFLI